MPVSYVGLGTIPNDLSGDPIRVAYSKVNDSLSGLYNFRTSSVAVNPTGIVTPLFIGEEIMTTVSGNFWWKAATTSITGWISLNGLNYPGAIDDWGTVP